MRDLTQQEIDDAPEWADGYAIDHDGNVEWYLGKCYLVEDANFFIEPQPIPRKPFDISEYEFDDKFHLTSCHVDECGDVSICLANSPADTYITKQDAIALAKHFKLI